MNDKNAYVIVQHEIMRRLALIFCLLQSVSVGAQELSREHDRFLNEEAVYIITSQERERFLSLPTVAERDDFIENFWRVRDPIPETADNEFKTEHFARLEEANRKYRESRAGWRTDRGRTYITLGPPQDVMAYPSNTDLYPIEIWFYYNLEIPNFPTSLQLLFYKRNGVGEYRLFSPAFDGMKSLIADPVKRGMMGVQGQIPASARTFWDIDIIKAAESVGPGENFLSSEQILGDLRTPGFIFEKTHRNLEERVTASASFGGELPFDLEIDFFRGEDGFSEAHLAIEIPASELHVNQYDRRLLGRYDVIATVRLLDTGEALEELRDTLELEVSESDWETVRHFPVLFVRKVDLLPGRYRLELFVRDYVGRKIGTVERVVAVPEFPPDRLASSSVLTAFKADEAPLEEEGMPHLFDRLRLFPRPNRVFGSGQRVLAFFEIYYPTGAFQQTPPTISARFTLRRGEEVVLDETNRYAPSRDAPGVVPALKILSGEVLSPGEYTLEALITEPTTDYQDFVTVDFTVAAPQELGRHALVGRDDELTPAQRYYRQAHHFLALGRYDEAIKRFAVSLDYEPYFQAARHGKARAEILVGRPDAGESTAREALRRDERDVEALALIGLAQFRVGELREAAEMYRRALGIAGDDPSLLNALGETELELGNREAAVQALERSLEVNPEQPDVVVFLQRIRP